MAAKRIPEFETPVGVELSPADFELAVRIHRSEWLNRYGVYPGTVVLDLCDGAKRLLTEKYPGLYVEQIEEQPC